MVDVMTAFTLVEHAGAATAQPPQGEPGYQRILSPERRPQRTRDGWISVLPYTRENFEDLFRAGGRDDLAEDGRIHSARVRGSTTPTTSTTRCRSSSPSAPPRHGSSSATASESRPRAVPTLDELVEGLPEDEHPMAGRYKVIPQPVRFARAAGPTVRRPAALSGEHTDEVMAEVAEPAPHGPAGPSAPAETRVASSLTETFGDVTAIRTATTSPRWRCTDRRPTTSTPRCWATSSPASAGPRTTGAGSVVLCSEGRHFCAGLDFGADRHARCRRPPPLVRPGAGTGRRAPARGGRRPGRGHRRRARLGHGRRLPGRLGVEPLRRQLRPPRIPSGVRAVGDPPAGGRPAARRSSS